MTAKEYNKKLLLVASIGDLSISGSLFNKYEYDFWEWYGDFSFKDYQFYVDFLEVDFFEWFRSRVLNCNDLIEEWAEILVEDLDTEIQSALVTNS